MSPQNQATNQPATTSEEIDFHGAALIDENGQEIPITEEMIQNACEELDGSDEQD